MFCRQLQTSTTESLGNSVAEFKYLRLSCQESSWSRYQAGMFDGESKGGGGREKREKEGQEGEEDKREWMVLSCLMYCLPSDRSITWSPTCYNIVHLNTFHSLRTFSSQVCPILTRPKPCSQALEKSEGAPGTHCSHMHSFQGNLETTAYVSVLHDCISLDH